jgi:hypothetical protein
MYPIADDLEIDALVDELHAEDVELLEALLLKHALFEEYLLRYGD